MIKLKTLLLPLSILILSGCHFGGDPIYASWYNVYGEPCGYSPRPGCNYYANGMKIMIWQDPFYTNQSWNDYWWSPSGIWYAPGGYAINAQADDESADVIGAVAAEEQKVIQQIGKVFAQKYALNEDTGVQIATTLQDWADIGKTRARTQADLNDFVKRLYGVDPTRAALALDQAAKRHPEALLELNTDVAAHWGTSPETSQMILREWYRRELSGLGF